MNPSHKKALLTVGRRWAMLTLAAYAILSIGLWIARVAFSAPLAPQSDSDTQALVIASITISGLYSAVLALRTPQAPDSASHPARP